MDDTLQDWESTWHILITNPIKYIGRVGFEPLILSRASRSILFQTYTNHAFFSRAIIPVGSSKQQQYQTTPENYNEDYYETDYLSSSNQEGD